MARRCGTQIDPPTRYWWSCGAMDVRKSLPIGWERPTHRAAKAEKRVSAATISSTACTRSAGSCLRDSRTNRPRARRSGRRPGKSLLDPELLSQKRVQSLRIGLAAACLHRLADEPAKHGRLGLGLFRLVGVGGKDLIDDLLDRPGIGDLFQAARFDDLARAAALGPDDLEDVLGDLAGDRLLADEVDDGADLVGRDRAVSDRLAFLVEAAGKLVDHPVRRELRDRKS